MNSKRDKSIQFSEFSAHFNNHVNNADNHRGESLLRLHKIRGGRQKSQERQLKRLKIKYGEDHPRVLRQVERIDGEKAMENYLSVIISKTEIETEIVENAFTLKGRILASNIKGLSGLNVQLQDQRNTVIGKPAVTDRKGFFTLVIDIEKPVKTRKAILVILDKSGTEIHKEKLPILVSSNAVEIRDIVLGKGDNPFRDNSAEIPGKAVPNEKPAVIKTKSRTKKRPVKKTARKKTKVSRKKSKVIKKKRSKLSRAAPKPKTKGSN